MVLYLFQKDWNPTQGRDMFLWMHVALMGSIWFIVPFVGADCISRERRLGTLGLLFLTPLRIHDVVLAKTTTLFFRTVKVVIAAIPVLMVPLLIGGVPLKFVFFSLVINLLSLIWVLALGVFASSVGRSMMEVAVFAILATVLGGHLFAFKITWSYTADGLPNLEMFFRFIENGLDFLLNPERATRGLGPAAWYGNGLFAQVGWFLGASVVLLGLAGQSIRYRWREEPPSVARLRIETLFTKPRFGVGALRKMLVDRLDDNPLAWLQHRSWKTRTVSRTLLLVLLMLYGSILWTWRMFRSDLGEIQYGLAFVLLVCVVVVASLRFGKERECGALELILVSPIGRKMVRERLHAVRGQFFWSFVLILAMWLIFFFDPATTPFGYSHRWRGSAWGQWIQVVDCLLMVAAYYLLPKIGLYFSMRMKHPFVATLLTLMVTFFLPWLLYFCGEWTAYRADFDWLGRHGSRAVFPRLFPALALIFAAKWLWGRLLRGVEERRFLSAP